MHSCLAGHAGRFELFALEGRSFVIMLSFKLIAVRMVFCILSFDPCILVGSIRIPRDK